MATHSHRFLRVVGFSIWLTLLLPVLVGAYKKTEGLNWPKAYPWIVLWLLASLCGWPLHQGIGGQDFGSLCWPSRH